ncbi:MAG: neutral/alkaline non-lysosomal ceramidase N-terminal domain-containing protein [Bryobacteraceae bacterium]
MRFFLLFALAAGSVSAAWMAGAAAVDITPTESIWMAGYASRTKPSEGVRQPIFAKALALRDDSGATSVMVTLDLVGIRRNMAEAIATRAQKNLGIARERIIFNASHTHSAPLVGDNSSYAYLFGDKAPEIRGAIERYTKAVEENIYTAVAKSVAALAPATLHFGQGFAGFAVNRRRVGHRDYPGPVDHDVPVLAVRDTAGRIKAVAFGYACHNTIMADYTIHGDYAGYAQARLEALYPGAVALFVQGAGADSNPLPRRKPEHLDRYGATLADAVEEVISGKMRTLNGPLRAAIEFPEVKFAPHTKAEFEEAKAKGSEVSRRHAEGQLRILDRDGKLRDTHPYPVQAWRFGSDLMLVTLAGELVVDYALKFKSRYGWDKTWIAGYSNDVFGYIPSLRVLKEGGYEGGEAFLFGSFPGAFADDIEDRITSAVSRVVDKVQ